jgi:kynurenine formamidase
VGEHAGTHLDAPVHWITGRDGKSVDQIERSRPGSGLPAGARTL